MRWAYRLLREYAQVIIVMLVAGMITGACAYVRTPDPEPRLKQCVQPIRLMPNWIQYWDTTRPQRWTL